MFKKIRYKDLKHIYSIDESGNVRNDKTNRILTPKTTKQGYREISLYTISGKLRTVRIHRLVALLFCDGYDECLRNEVNHKDFNKSNNHYTNLEWVSRDENIAHADMYGMLAYHGETNPSHKYSDEFVEKICQYLESGLTFDQILLKMECSNNKSVRKLLTRIKNHESHTHISKKYDIDSEPMVRSNSRFKDYYFDVKNLMMKGLDNDEIFKELKWDRYHGKDRERRRDFIRLYRKKFVKYNCEGSTTIERGQDKYLYIDINLG